MADTRFIDDFTAAFAWFDNQRSQDPAWWRAARRASVTAFRSAGLPTRKDEDWRYTSLRPLTSRRYRVFGGEDVAKSGAISSDLCKQIVGDGEPALVFVDGELSTALTRLSGLPSGVTVEPIDAAAKRGLPAVRAALEAAPHPDYPFALLSGAFARDGIAVVVAPGVHVTKPIHVIHVASGAVGTGDTPSFFPRHVVALGAGSAATVVESYAGAAAPYLVAPATDLVVGPDATLRHVRLNLEGATALHFGRWSATLERGATLKSLNVTAGPRLARHDIDITLAGEGAEAHLDAVILAKGEAHVDNRLTVNHKSPKATSRQLVKSVLDNDARAVFSGEICVARDAQGTNAAQQIRNLLLSKTCEADSKPSLKIDADDVKCSHGAATGPLDEDQLFYLESRGIKADQARRMLALAFADEILLRYGDLAAISTMLRKRAGGYFSL